jgi:hypothetical protein
MRRTIFLSGWILVWIVFGAQAQKTVFRPEFAVGVSGGFNFASTSFSPKVLQGSLIAPNAGLTLRWLTEKNCGVQVELNYKQQGWSEKFEDPETSEPLGYNYSRKMSYIEIPFLTHVYFGQGKVNYFVNLGPQLGYLISESTDSNLDGDEPGNVNAQHTMEADKKFEWGLGGGPGIELRTGAGNFLLEGRFYYALSDFYNTRRKDYFSKASSQVISVKLTYLFRVK